MRYANELTIAKRKILVLVTELHGDGHGEWSDACNGAWVDINRGDCIPGVGMEEAEALLDEIEAGQLGLPNMVR